MTHLKGQNLVLSFQGQKAVDDVSLSLEAGRVTALVGPNGSGKSTVLKILSRHHRPDAGAVTLNGDPISRLGSKALARRIAILPQVLGAPPGLSVEALVAHGRFPHKGLLGRERPEDREAIAWALQQTRLEKMRQREVSGLSGGERQRVWIAMALAQKTEILLLDEPTTYLDVAHQQEVLETVREINKQHGITVGWVLHDLNQAAYFSDRIVVLKQGRIFADGTPEQVMSPKILRGVFGLNMIVIDHPRTGAKVSLVSPR